MDGVNEFPVYDFPPPHRRSKGNLIYLTERMTCWLVRWLEYDRCFKWLEERVVGCGKRSHGVQGKAAI